MSMSSRMLKAIELPDLYLAQVHAAAMPDYLQWRTWMRETYTYALVVRMSIHMGCKIPGRGFFNLMRQQGLKSVGRKAA